MQHHPGEDSGRRHSAGTLRNRIPALGSVKADNPSAKEDGTAADQFGEILRPANFDELLWGMLSTLRLSAETMVLSLAFAIVGAMLRTSGPKAVQALIGAYVEIIRNTPFLVQIFMVFFGLPTIGLRLDANGAALVAMVLNGSAYTIEIARAGIESIPPGQMDNLRS